MPLVLPSESDMEIVGSHKSPSNDSEAVMASRERKDGSIAYPGRGDNTHVLDCQNYTFHTPEVDDDGSETEYLTEDEHAVELALKHPNKFSESMVIEVSLQRSTPSNW